MTPPIDNATFLARVGQRADGVWVTLDTGEPLGPSVPVAPPSRARAAALDEVRRMTADVARRKLARIAALTAQGWPYA